VFMIETFLEAVLPIFTSPKSIVSGFTTTSAEAGVVDEKAREFDPHPDKLRQSKNENAARTAAPLRASIVFPS